jgi:hypothetical protein
VRLNWEAMMATRALAARDSVEGLSKLPPRHRLGAAQVAERIGDMLGWLGGVATVYGPVSVVAAGAVWGVVSVARFAALQLLTSASG